MFNNALIYHGLNFSLIEFCRHNIHYATIIRRKIQAVRRLFLFRRITLFTPSEPLLSL